MKKSGYFMVVVVLAITALFTMGCETSKVNSENVTLESNNSTEYFLYKEYTENFVNIPGKKFAMMKTEVTQKLYKTVMGSNPSEFKGDDKPVEHVTYYDAIYFCNKLSEMLDLKPVYKLNGNSNIDWWDYKPHSNPNYRGTVTIDSTANGFRLPTLDEWLYAAEGGEYYNYAGSDNLDDVAWYYQNSNKKTHPVGKKKPNGYGLYDMYGNVWELFGERRYVGMSCYSRYYYGLGYLDYWYGGAASYYYVGFRVVCPAF